MITSSLRSNRSVALWLLICCAGVFVMAILGAITRLTGSGLSMTTWDPIMGALPPHNQLEWQKAFLGYQKIPQYQLLNHGMSLAEFKGIFFWEWFHRLWGRFIGLLFVLPLIVFGIKKKIDKSCAQQLLIIFMIGALQGFVGWFMVMSGLEVRTSVSPYRLALHLSFALLIYAAMLRMALQLLDIPTFYADRKHIFLGKIVLGFLILTMVWGAFVAGLHAGETYNTWPLMEGDVLPDAAFTLLPKWLNVFENLALVQFIHRWIAPTTLFILLFWVHTLRKNIQNRLWPNLLAMMGVMQFLLGLSTLLSHTNIVLAVLHQAGAITLLTLVLINLWKIKPQDV